MADEQDGVVVVAREEVGDLVILARELRSGLALAPAGLGLELSNWEPLDVAAFSHHHDGSIGDVSRCCERLRDKIS